MKAWQIDRLGGHLHLNNIEVPEVRSGSVLVRVEAQALMSYWKDYIEGKLAHIEHQRAISSRAEMQSA